MTHELWQILLSHNQHTLTNQAPNDELTLLRQANLLNKSAATYGVVYYVKEIK